MNSRNGVSREFRFTIEHPVTRTRIVIDFSFKYQAMKYWTVEKWITHTDIGGRRKQKFQYLHHYFQIDWSQLITGGDADQLSRVRNAEFDGAKLLLTPHTDVAFREYEVMSLKDSSGNQEIEFSQIANQPWSPGNQGTVVTYVTVNPVYHWEIIDPSVQQGIISRIFQLIQG